LYRLTIGSFNLEEFFFAIVETLDDAEDPWAMETLGWINEYIFDLLSMSTNKYYRQVFSKHAAKAIMATLDDTDSDLAKMRAKCAARKQGASSTAATSNAVASALPRLPPPKPTRKEAAPLTAATTSIPPPSQRPVTPPSCYELG